MSKLDQIQNCKTLLKSETKTYDVASCHTWISLVHQ
jgi:hypothetical protein